jgi:hypothetical protein
MDRTDPSDENNNINSFWYRVIEFPALTQSSAPGREVCGFAPLLAALEEADHIPPDMNVSQSEQCSPLLALSGGTGNISPDVEGTLVWSNTLVAYPYLDPD